MEVGEDYCAECTDHGPITDQPQDNPAQPSSDMPPAQETSSAGPTILPHQAAVPEENICGDTTKADADKFEAQGSPVKSVRIDADSVVSEGHSASERAVRDVSISCRPYEPSETNSMVPVDDDLSMVGLRGKNNTPTSLYTDFSELQPKSTLDGLGRGNGPGPGSREAAYRRALTLMSERCLSRGHPPRHGRDNRNSCKTYLTSNGRSQTPLVCVKPRPFGEYRSKFFFVNQRKPVPMPPLKAWRGYHGNVYFEPIEVKSAILDGDTLEGQLTNASAICRLASRNQPLPEPTTSDLPSLVPERGRSKAPASRPIPRSGSSPSSSLGGHGPRPMAVLDKRQVLRSHNEHLREDLQWIHGQESTGSLCISPDSEARRRALLSKERICKGSMAHRVFMQRQAICSSSAPQLRPGPEHGGFNRRVLNSPQLKGTDKLPPLAPIGSV